MSRNKVILIILASVLLVTALIFSFAEYTEVPAHEWKEKYNYRDQQPQGLYIFKELANRYFEDIPTTLNGYPEDTINTNSLYIQFVPEYLEWNVLDTLLDIAEVGNDVLIIADFSNDGLESYLDVEIDDPYINDSTLTFNFTDPDLAADTNFQYSFQSRAFENNIPTDFYLMGGMNPEDHEAYAQVVTPDSLIIMASFPVGEGRVFYHVKKDLFYNYSYRQNQIFDYTQKVFSFFEPQHVYLLNPITLYNAPAADSENPLEFIMSQPALKAAYYLMIFGVLLYVFFGGKRKQKIIPVTIKNKNTSLEYIETVSQLFYQQGQHEKLVAHMRNIFHHKMQKRFFVAPDNPNYLAVLSKKSKISETELQYVMDRFKNLDDNFEFRGDQLVSLNRRLENIYKEIEKKS